MERNLESFPSQMEPSVSTKMTSFSTKEPANLISIAISLSMVRTLKRFSSLSKFRTFSKEFSEYVTMDLLLEKVGSESSMPAWNWRQRWKANFSLHEFWKNMVWEKS